ncbi:SDR family oxidoreductase [Streptomyces sp. NBC_01089]|uniref:SDR family oxidoreductase n=1 Tax=Streptomyces sp. NBC_01089 TaxID=2903747 RepID=UPI00386CDE68|nr:SDR family oxidoreductase [Streptomyces sp. NBC_01089]
MTTETHTDRPLSGRIALVAGATRGAGRAIAVQLGAAGATVYATGRTTRRHRSEVGRAETIEETAELIGAAGGAGYAVPTDHLEEAQVRALAERIDGEQGRLDILVNDVWGGDHLARVGEEHKMWEIPLAEGLRMLDLGVRSHIITSSALLPLLARTPGGLVVEVTDGTAESNRDYRVNFFYDLAKSAPIRMAAGLAHELGPVGSTAICVTPGFLRSEAMLDHFGVTEATWRDAIATEPHFAIAESPVFVGRAVAAVAADPDRARWNGQSLSSGQLAAEYGFTDTDGSRPDAWRYIKEVALGGADRTAEEYR